MITLSEAVAQELRAELAVRGWHMDELSARSGHTKTTGWRHIKGTSRLSIDDVEAYARGLGWTLDKLVARARVRQAESEEGDATTREAPASAERE